MGVEVRELRALLAVVRCRSFTVAARELGFTQSALSQQVVLLRLDVAHSELARYRLGPSAVRVAVAPLATPQLLAAALRMVRSSRPELKVAVTSLEATAALGAVATGAVDRRLGGRDRRAQ
jgi:DNA-binding transcriptional LysR family regulator